jgi:hypothetical protein
MLPRINGACRRRGPRKRGREIKKVDTKYRGAKI